MYNLIIQLKDADPYTQAEAKRAIERVLDEALKIRGHIARDLRKLGGDNGFERPDCYSKLKVKYSRARKAQMKKTLAILELEKRKWCKRIEPQ